MYWCSWVKVVRVFKWHRGMEETETEYFVYEGGNQQCLLLHIIMYLYLWCHDSLHFMLTLQALIDEVVNLKKLFE
jgi:hypothetical protein